jgi:WD40 repeat protein
VQVRSLTFLTGGSSLATGSTDNTVKIWDLATATAVTTFEGGSLADGILAVKHTPTRPDIVCSLSSDGWLMSWDVRSRSRAWQRKVCH